MSTGPIKTYVIYILVSIFQLRYTSIFFVIAQESGNILTASSGQQASVVLEEPKNDFIIEIPPLATPTLTNILEYELPSDTTNTDILTGNTQVSEEGDIISSVTGVVAISGDTQLALTSYDIDTGVIMRDGVAELRDTNEEITLYEDSAGEYITITAYDEVQAISGNITSLGNSLGSGQQFEEKAVILVGTGMQKINTSHKNRKKQQNKYLLTDILTIKDTLLLQTQYVEPREELIYQEDSTMHYSASQNTGSNAYFKRNTTVKSVIKGSVVLDDLIFEELLTTPTGFGYPILAGLMLGPSDDHLIFSQPVQLDIFVGDIFNNQELAVYVHHAGDAKFGTTGLSTNPTATCLPDGSVDISDSMALVQNGIVTIYTCGASTFTVTYVGGATYANFVDNGVLEKTISVTTNEVGSGVTIQDMQVVVDFHSIDSEDPNDYGFTNAYSNELSMRLMAPDGTTMITLLAAGSYDRKVYAPRATVNFDDAATVFPSGIPTSGTFLPSQSLSTFDGMDPLGDRTFLLEDDTNLDGVILYSVSLVITDDAVCGDGVLAGGEGCDDGGTTGGDGCSATCLIEDGYDCNISGGGAKANASCESQICDQTETTPICSPEDICGNSVKESGEQCDDGNTEGGDGCSSTCQIEFCGDGVIDLVPEPGAILFEEDFENIGDGTASSSGTVIYTITGYSLIFFSSGSPGRARYGTAAVQMEAGSGAITLDVSTNNSPRTNDIVFEIDMTDALGSADIELAFDFSHHADAGDLNDKVRIRGSSGDSWLQLYDWYANRGTKGVYTQVSALDVDNTLSVSNQVFSESFQIKFGWEGAFPATSTTQIHGLSIDNVKITGTIIGPASSETCDDSNQTNGDGCDSICKVEDGYECTEEPSICIFVEPILINEVEYDTPGSESEGEWFELYNTSTTTVSLSGWSITEKVDPSSSKTYTFGSSVSITGGGYLLVVNDGTEFANVYTGVTPDVDMPGTGYFQLKNSADDYLLLKNQQGDDVDFVARENTGSGWSIEAIDASICRLSAPDTDTVADWTNTCPSTPGSANFPDNDAPTDITLSSTGVNENVAIGTLIGYLSGTDSDGDTLTFSFTSGTGDTYNQKFTIVGDELFIQVSPDYELLTGYDIRIQVADAFGGTYEETFLISVTNLGELFDFSAKALDGDGVQIGADSTVFNSTNLEKIERMEIEFTIDCPLAFTGHPTINYTADRTNACALGNKQNTTCYSYASGSRISYLSGQETSTFKDEGDVGDYIACTNTGNVADTQRTYTCTIDEHYNPNVFKRYGAGYDFADVKWQDGNNQKITKNTFIRIEIDETAVSVNADWYKLDFRVQATNNPTHDLEAYLCNSSYTTGDPSLTTDCSFVVQRGADELSDDGTKFRGIFQYEAVSELGNAKYVVLKTDTNNPSKYYALKTFAASTTGWTTHRDYSNDEGSSWSNAADGYETELNINWFHNGAANTAIVFDIDSCGDRGHERVVWDIEPTQDYEPLVDMIVPEDSIIVSGTIDISWLVNDPNGEDYTVDVTAFDGSGTVVIGTGFASGTTTTVWSTTGVANGSWDITIQTTEVVGYKTVLTGSDMHTVIIDNPSSSTGEVNVSGPTGFAFSGSYQSASYEQTMQQQFTGYFSVSDTLGIDSGYYTTLQVTSFTGSVYTGTISNTQLERKASGPDYISGDSNTGVVLPTNWSGYTVATGTITFIKRDLGVNDGKTGTYGSKPRLRLTVPPYTKSDTYAGTITYTLYEN